MRSLSSFHLTCNCLPLALGAKWQGAIWLQQLYLGWTCHESDVLFLLEGRLCLLLGLTSQFNLQLFDFWVILFSVADTST